MKEVPNIISTKDLSYIQDMLNWNMTLCKKAKMYKTLAKDKEIKALFDKVNKMHKEHYETLMEILG